MVNDENISKELFSYIEENVLPKYEGVNDGHGIDHIEDVIKWSFKIANMLQDEDINNDIIYASAVYHDIGNIVGDRETHHKESFEYVLKDTDLLEYLSLVGTYLTAMACLEHRASYTGEYTSIYSKIVSDADRCSSLDINNMILRSYKFTKSKNPTLSDEDTFEEVYAHLNNKYGKGGYMDFKLDVTEKLMGEELENSQNILNNMDEFRVLYYITTTKSNRRRLV